ncbi:hypothetical protein ALO_00875, partial [Acetonema longum DSM 6540]
LRELAPGVAVEAVRFLTDAAFSLDSQVKIMTV